MEDKKSPCTPDAKAISYPLVNPPLTTRVQMPMPREFNGEKYYGTADVAKIMGVTQQTVSRWQNELYMGAPLFTADERAHDGRYLYKVERVMQLKEIYHPDWKRGGYQTSPTCTGQEAVISQQERIAEAVKFFDFLYDRVPTPTFIYLAKFKDKREFPAFSATDAKQRQAMAVKAVELSELGNDIWHSVNPVSVKPSGGKRGDESAVAYQVAIVTDIDIRSDAHKSENLAADFDEAKSFLPFAPTILINSGYGIQAYYIFDTPIKITDENREECKRRNELFLDVIRARANGKTIDAVGDLPRILRTPGTFNYKLGTLNAPLCHIVDFSDVRFTPAEIDEKLAALPIPATPSKPVDVDKSARNHREVIDDSDFDIYRARRMLDFINPANLTYDEWFAVGAALKNVGCDCSDWEQWSKVEDRFKDGECQYKWDTFDRDGYGIGTLYQYAVEGGYDAKEIYREYADTHPDFARKRAGRADERPVDTENFIGTKKKISSCPIDLKIPKCFVFSARGISFCVKGKADKETGEQEFKYLPVANTALVPTKIFYNPEKKTDEYEIGIFSRDTWRFAEVDARTLGDTKKLNTLCDYGALIDDYARLRSYFNAIIANNDIPVIKAYDKTGWADFDCTEFIYPHENAPYLLRRSGFSFADVFKPKGNAEEWLLKFAEIIEMAGAPALVVIGLELAAPLVRPLGLPNLQAHLYGTSGIGKTALPRFGASVFGNPNNGGLSRTFSATYKNLLETSAAYCDLPIVLEEKETLNSKKEEDLQQAIYDYEQGVCNQAQKRDGTSREIKRFYGTRISTGEHPLLKDNSKDGANKRYLPLKVTKLFDDETAKGIHRFYNHNHGLFGLQWVRYIPAHMDDIRKDFAEVYALIEQQEKKINPTHATTLAAALTAVYNFKKCVDLYSEDFEAAEQNEILAAVKWTVDQLPAADAQIDYKRAIDDLSSFYNSHEKYFSRDIESPTDSDKTEFISARAPESYGHCFIDGEIAFYRTSLIKILEKELGYASGKKLIDDFCTHGLLKHNAGLVTYKIYINEERKRVILFKANVLNEIEDDE